MDEKKGKILVLDDEQIVLESVSRILEDEFVVTTCRRGEEAIEALQTGGFDIFMTDLKMPGMNGLEAIEAMAKIDPDLSVIMFTAYSTVDSAVKAMKLGAIDYIRKPFTPDQLLELVDQVMENRKARSEARYREISFSEVKKAISSTLNLKEVLELVVKGVSKVLDVKGATLSLLDPDRQELCVLASHGLSREYVFKGPIDSSRSLPETVSEGRFTWVEDAWNDPRVQFPLEAKREKVKSILSVPLVVRDKVIGVLRVYTGKPRRFSEDEAKLLLRFADQAALAIENARSYEDFKDKYEALRTNLWEYYSKDGYAG